MLVSGRVKFGLFAYPPKALSGGIWGSFYIHRSTRSIMTGRLGIEQKIRVNSSNLPPKTGRGFDKLSNSHEQIPTWSLTANAPEKLPSNPKRKPDHLPTMIFQGRTVKLWGCIPFWEAGFFSCFFLLTSPPGWYVWFQIETWMYTASNLYETQAL